MDFNFDFWGAHTHTQQTCWPVWSGCSSQAAPGPPGFWDPPHSAPSPRLRQSRSSPAPDGEKNQFQFFKKSLMCKAKCWRLSLLVLVRVEEFFWQKMGNKWKYLEVSGHRIKNRKHSNAELGLEASEVIGKYKMY